MSEYNSVKNNSKESVFANLIWRFAERCGAQGLSFIVSIVLARLLEPEVYGTVAIVTVIISILNVFVDSGMGNALVQKKDADDLDFSSVFYFNIVFCLILYAILFFASPILAELYNDPELVVLFRVLGLTIIISGLKNIQLSYVYKTMKFKNFFFSTLGGTIVASIVGIVMAYSGFGVWALVAQYVSSALINAVILWFVVKWRPKFYFSFVRLKGLVSYGWKILASNLLETIYNNIQQLVIGGLYSSSDLAFHNRGKSFPLLLIENINTSINSVLFPTMSNSQDDQKRLREMTRRSLKVSLYVMAPIMIGLCAVATPFIRLVLTEKWLPCVPYLRIFCVAYMLYPFHTSNLNAVLAVGRSGLYLKLEIIKKTIGLAMLLFSIRFGVIAMAYSFLISTIISMAINSWPNRKLLKYGFFEQIKDILPELLLSVFMGGCVSLVSLFGLSDVITLSIQILLGVLIYLAGTRLFKLDSFDYLWGIISSYFKKSKNK